MSMDLALKNGLSLRIAPRSENHTAYPTTHLQRGLVLIDHQQDLCEEAVGFGVPILKLKLRTIFPSAVELSSVTNGSTQGIRATYTLDLEEKIQKTNDGIIHNPVLYAIKNLSAATIRESPPLRGLLTRTSSLLRHRLGLETSYQPSGISTSISLTYTLEAEADKINVSLDGFDHTLKGLTEVVIMNEQGAHTFDHYQDSDGVFLSADQIGCWDPVLARQATFRSSARLISFSLPQVPGARLYRGRELVGDRLAWAGFGYSFQPTLQHFAYQLTLHKAR